MCTGLTQLLCHLIWRTAASTGSPGTSLSQILPTLFNGHRNTLNVDAIISLIPRGRTPRSGEAEQGIIKVCWEVQLNCHPGFSFLLPFLSSFLFLFLPFSIYFYLGVCLCRGACTCQERASDPLVRGNWELMCMRELNSGPLEEQQALFTSEPSPGAQSLFEQLHFSQCKRYTLYSHFNNK